MRLLRSCSILHLFTLEIDGVHFISSKITRVRTPGIAIKCIGPSVVWFQVYVQEGEGERTRFLLENTLTREECQYRRGAS